MAHCSRSDSQVARRSVLAGLTAGLATTSGCLGRIRALVGRDQPRTVSLSIKALPVDEDPFAIAIARQLAAWLDTAGIRTSVQPMTAEELYRQTLINHDFDIFVGQYPVRPVTPDILYSMLHSRFSVESGLQNPFGYASFAVDDLLEQQRQTTGQRRQEAVATIQRRIVQECPFTVLGFPDIIRAARTDAFSELGTVFEPSPIKLLSLVPTESSATTLRATTPDDRPMSNLNPLMSTFRGTSDVTDLIYDSLARRYEGTMYPWMADSLEWVEQDQPELRVTLRDDLSWHDGTPLTAPDVSFTYRLLRDTSLGTQDQNVPTLRFRGESTLVEQVLARDDSTVTLQFTDCSREVARQALTVPILPRHVWEDRTRRAVVSGIDVGAPTTEALVNDAIPPVGSGPLQFVEATQRQSLVLDRFDDHFLERDDVGSVPAALASGTPFAQFELQFVASDSAAVDLIANGEADVTLLGVGPDLTRTIGRQSSVSLTVQRSDAFYFLGFNTRQSPLSNPRFRNLLSRLIDRATLAESVFDGYINPAVSPLAGTGWLPADLEWTEAEPVTQFLGSDGSVTQQLAHEAFRTAGYRYNEQGRLLRS